MNYLTIWTCLSLFPFYDETKRREKHSCDVLAFSKFIYDAYLLFSRPLSNKDLKQELQVRQRTIHERPDNEKNTGNLDLMKGVKTMDGLEKSDPMKSPVVFKPHVDSNRFPAPASPLTASGIPGISKCKYFTSHGFWIIYGFQYIFGTVIWKELSTFKWIVTRGFQDVFQLQHAIFNHLTNYKFYWKFTCNLRICNAQKSYQCPSRMSIHVSV